LALTNNKRFLNREKKLRSGYKERKTKLKTICKEKQNIIKCKRINSKYKTTKILHKTYRN